MLDDRIFAEYQEVLTRPLLAHYFRKSEVSHILDYISHCGYRVIATESIRGLPHPGDIPSLEVAWEANKSAHIQAYNLDRTLSENSMELATKVPLVTGNHQHFPRELCRGIQVLSPAGFMDAWQTRHEPWAEEVREDQPSYNCGKILATPEELRDAVPVGRIQ